MIADAPTLPGYVLERRLGHGRTGVVYLAREERAGGRRVAVKHFAEDAVEAFEEELRALQAIEELRARHPDLRVAGPLEAGEAGGRRYIAFELAEAGSLADHVRAKGPLPSAEALRLIRSALSSVALLHEAGLCHRDLTPSNLLLDAHGEVVVADLGTARALGRVTTAAGTPAFAPPEILRGERACDGRRVDVYGLGATLFFLLTGAPPAPGRPDPFVLERAGVPRGVQRTLFRLVATDPEQRPIDGRAVLAQVSSLIEDPARPATASAKLRTSPDSSATSHEMLLERDHPCSAPDALHRSVRRAGVLAFAGAFCLVAVIAALSRTRTTLLPGDHLEGASATGVASPAQAPPGAATPGSGPTPGATLVVEGPPTARAPSEAAVSTPATAPSASSAPAPSAATSTKDTARASGAPPVPPASLHPRLTPAPATPAAPPAVGPAAAPPATTPARDEWIHIPAGTVALGDSWTHVDVASFRIARRLASVDEYARLLDSAAGMTALEATMQGEDTARWLEVAIPERANFVFAADGEEHEVKGAADLLRLLAGGPFFWGRPDHAPPRETWAGPRDGPLPVFGLTWFEAEAFARFRGGRLPTIAERRRAAAALRAQSADLPGDIAEWCADAPPGAPPGTKAIWRGGAVRARVEVIEANWCGLSGVRLACAAE